MTSPPTSRSVPRSVAALTILVLLAGCAPSGPPSAATPPPPTPASSAFLDALEHTRSLGTATVQVAVDAAGPGTRLSGSGAVALYDGYGSLLWESADGEDFAERSNGRGIYVQDDPPSGAWRTVTGPTRTSPLADPLRGLGQVVSPQAQGSEVVDGRTAQRFVGRAPGTREQLTLAGLPPGDPATPTTAADSEVEVTAWIDDRGRIIRIDRVIVPADGPAGSAAPDVTARTSTLLSDFSRVIDLSTPATLAD